MQFTVEIDREDDRRSIAEVRELHGVLAYGTSPEDAIARAKALAICLLAERVEHGETKGIED